MNGRKQKLEAGDFRAFGAALKLTDRQIANALSRFEKNLAQACDLILSGFCGSATKERYCKLVLERSARLGLNS